MSNKLLQVEALQTHFLTEEGEVPAVDHVSFHVDPGEVVGIVGESGCGKSVTSLSIMGLIPTPPGQIVGGDILFKERNLVKLSEKAMRKIRGNEIAMIFQEPMTSLDPLFTIGNQMRESLYLHQKMSKKVANKKVIELLQLVGLARAEEVIHEYPHQLSGGMRQRVMIAMAMLCEPDLLIADEPTTALDVTIQAQILDLMRTLNEEKNTAILLITHDLAVVAEMCDRMIVMYAGQVVEQGTVREVLKDPTHPYTKGLIKSIPRMDKKNQALYSIKGTVPRPKKDRIGCRFAPRCDYAFERCFGESPGLYELDNERLSRCFLQDKAKGDAWTDDKTIIRS